MEQISLISLLQQFENQFFASAPVNQSSLHFKPFATFGHKLEKPILSLRNFSIPATDVQEGKHPPGKSCGPNLSHIIARYRAVSSASLLNQIEHLVAVPCSLDQCGHPVLKLDEVGLVDCLFGSCKHLLQAEVHGEKLDDLANPFALKLASQRLISQLCLLVPQEVPLPQQEVVVLVVKLRKFLNTFLLLFQANSALKTVMPDQSVLFCAGEQLLLILNNVVCGALFVLLAVGCPFEQTYLSR